MEFDRRLGLGTDSAHLMIFDPTLVEQAREWPIAWYTEPAVWQDQSAKGHLAAWCTGSDGGFALRLTTGGLTDVEKSLAGPSWTFLLRSTGRVIADGDYLLPADQNAPRPADEAATIDLPEGLWQVTVTAIEWTASDLPQDEASKKFANYVVAFAPAEDAPTPQIAQRPPDLICLRDETAHDALPAPVTVKDNRPDISGPIPAGLSKNVVPPRGHFTSEGESNLLMSITPEARAFDAFRMPYFIGASLEIGAIGQICRFSGSGGAPGRPPRFTLTSQFTARITAIEGRLHEGTVIPLKKRWLFGSSPPPLGDYLAPLLQVRAEFVEPDMKPPQDLPLEAFKAALLESLDSGSLSEALGNVAAYHRLVLAEVESYPALATFAAQHLPMNAKTRADLSAKDFAPRVHALMEHLR
ncbi:hypothetical protein [Gymnodinialimonas hymeniacidonis]|uniref:hypothetical protein n=1 Tax=Gymnodinialimonas hymeniacidonis TaxID=3126508 RepID=UPI0034C5D83D